MVHKWNHMICKLLRSFFFTQHNSLEIYPSYLVHQWFISESMCVCSVAQPYPTICDPMDCSPPGSSVHSILQVRILESVAILFSRGFSQPRDRTLSLASPALQVDSLPFEPPEKPRFPRQEYWNRLPFPPIGNLPDPGIKATSPSNPLLQ